MGEFYVPDEVWEYLAACFNGKEVVPVSVEFLAVEVIVNGMKKPFGELTPDDLRALASYERQRVTDLTLDRLDRVDRHLRAVD